MWWGGCAWDSFGIGAALGEPVVTRTRCPGCGRDSRWWDDVVSTCSNIRLFCDPSHVESWARTGSHPVGEVIASDTMWQLAQTWYGDRLDPDWSPRPIAVAQRLLEQCGLSGGFWRLAR
jgi:hypothetical protein